jgi:hypothetical protein
MKILPNLACTVVGALLGLTLWTPHPSGNLTTPRSASPLPQGGLIQITDTSGPSFQVARDSEEIFLGGPVSPDGKFRVQCPLPASEKKANRGGTDGAGLCVFTSIEWSARWANEPLLIDFQAQMTKEKGGGWPDKVDKMMAKYAPGARYLQYEGTDPSILYRALMTGRMPAVTYCGYDPHYRGGISHMVNLAGINQEWAVVSDNNHPQDNHYVWMRPNSFFKRWTDYGQEPGWAVILVNPPPPPKPFN